MSDPMSGLFRVCVKLYSPEPRVSGGDADLFVPIFHEWIRDQALDMVLFDVADYAHVPDGPGIMLVAHEASFGLDRSDGRFGLLAQRRIPHEEDAAAVIETTLRQALEVAAKLSADPRLSGQLDFDTAHIRVEANDRLRAPNSDAGYAAFEPAVREGVARVFRNAELTTRRISNDPRDRLSIEVRVGQSGGAEDHLAA